MGWPQKAEKSQKIKTAAKAAGGAKVKG